MSNIFLKPVLQCASVGTLAQIDGGSDKYRIGLIELANDYFMERNFMNSRAADDVVMDVRCEMYTRVNFAIV